MASRGRLAAYLSGILLLAISLLSPIDALGGQLFFMHMTQHMIMITFAAPLLWSGDPFPISMWALPKQLQRLAVALLTKKSPPRQFFTAITTPALSWFLFIAVYLGWHDPGLYNQALYHDWVHDIQHLSFFAVALLYWRPVLDGAPHLHKRMSTWARVAYLLSVIPPSMAAGIAIATSNTVIYTYYNSAPNLYGIDRLFDQAMAGAIMWIPGNEMQVQIAVILLYRWLRHDERAENALRQRRTRAKLTQAANE
jgi:cytochrome c oxidase assembly factor CtaG